MACLSPITSAALFTSQAVGVGPARYVMQRRLERAKTLMRQTNQPLALIAQEVGFADQSHLTSGRHPARQATHSSEGAWHQ
ncbi:MAG TPA: helix-turn-helix domain-containing protein [Stellaceae bacterium]|nr:helix-turn-helix domain-containing protein [Stellaceae bacterium]